MRILIAICLLLFACGLQAQNVDTTKYTPNAGYGSKFQRVKGTYSVMIPVFGRGGDTTSKVPGELVIIDNNVWFCGTDNHYHYGSSTTTTLAKLIQGPGIYIANPDSTYDPLGFTVTIAADTAFLRNYFNLFYSSTKNIVDSASFTFIVDSISNSPPGYAVSGNKYLVGTSPTGAFALHANDIAELVGASYTFTTPSTGDQLWVSNPTQGASAYRFDGTNWILLYVVITQNGNSFGVPVRIGTNDNHELDFIQNGSVAGEFDTGRNFLITKLANLEDSNVLLTLGAGGRIDTVMAHQWVAGNGITFTPGANRTDTISSSGGGGVTQAQLDDSTAAIRADFPAPRPQNGFILKPHVVWLHDYVYNVSAGTYIIDGITYNSPSTDITLSAADPSLDRIDVFAVTTSSTAIAITGTPASPPVEPSVDAATELEVSFATVNAGTTEPVITNEWIYLENTQWTTSASAGTINPSSTNNPYAGTKDVEGTSVANNTYITFTPSSAPNMGLYQSLIFEIRSKANWNTTKHFIIRFYNGTTAIGSPVNFGQSSYGFVSTNTTTYQTVTIPLSDFGSISTATVLRITQSNSSGTSGWYLDNLQLQSPDGGGTPQTITLTTDATGTGTNTISTTVTGIRNKSVPSLSAGFLKYSGSAWTFDNSTYLTGNQTISFAPTGDVTGSTTGATTLAPALTIGSNKVTDAMIRQSAGLSVIGRSTNSTGNVADITASSDFTVFRRTGTSIGFGSLKADHLNATYSNGYFLQTDGSGNLSWAVASSGGITTLNTLTGSTQTFATGTAGTDFGISSSGTIHTFNLPTASASNRGLLSTTDWSTFNGKLSNITGLLTAGTNMSVTGSGTSGSPYVVNTSANLSLDSIHITRNSLGSTTGNGLVLENTTAATGGAQTQVSPDFFILGTRWTGSISIPNGFRMYVSNAPGSKLNFDYYNSSGVLAAGITFFQNEITSGTITSGTGSLSNLTATNAQITNLNYSYAVSGGGNITGMTIGSASTNIRSSGTFINTIISNTYNQTGGSTNSNYDLLISRAETAVGSGTQRFLSAQISGTEKFGVDNKGMIMMYRPIATNGSTPSNSLGTGAGTSPTASVTGNDISGYVTINTGTSPTASGNIITITFATALTNTPTSVQLTPANEAAATELAKFYVDQANTTSSLWIIKNTSSALTGSTTYKFYYNITQ